jgi:hypothetical protein
MAVRTLLSAMSSMMSGDSQNLVNSKVTMVKYAGAGGGDDKVQFVDQGHILEVLGDGQLRVQVKGRTFNAGQATDQPLRAGQGVYVSPLGQAGDSLVVHGGA